MNRAFAAGTLSIANWHQGRATFFFSCGPVPACRIDIIRGEEKRNIVTMVSSTYSNASDKGWIVQKFGGTSVGKFPDKVSSFFLCFRSCTIMPFTILVTDG